MRIAINGILLTRCVSGVETAIANLARALARCGQEEYILYLPEPAAVPDITGPRFRTVRCRLPLRSRLGRMFWEQVTLPRLVRRAGVDLLHAPGYLAPLAPGVPVVITVYDLIALLFPRLCTLSNAINYRLQLPLSVARANGIIACSEATRRDLLHRYPKAAPRTSLVPLGVSAEFHPWTDAVQKDALRRRYALPERFILFVGQLEPKKNLAGLLRAFAALRAGGLSTHQLVIAGSRGWGCAAFEQTLAELALGPAVVLPGFIPPADLPGVYSLADLFVFPSLCEGFGLPPLEAMACGVPVVVSNRGALPETVGEAARVVDPMDTAALADAMREILTQDELRRTLVRRGLEHVRPFTWDRTALATEAVYRAVLSRRCAT